MSYSPTNSETGGGGRRPLFATCLPLPKETRRLFATGFLLSTMSNSETGS